MIDFSEFLRSSNGILNTQQAAAMLNRRPQTLRLWACGARPAPIQPIRINGRLAWRVSDIQALIGGAQK